MDPQEASPRWSAKCGLRIQAVWSSVFPRTWKLPQISWSRYRFFETLVTSLVPWPNGSDSAGIRRVLRIKVGFAHISTQEDWVFRFVCQSLGSFRYIYIHIYIYTYIYIYWYWYAGVILVHTGDMIVDGIDGDLGGSNPLATEYPNSVYIYINYIFMHTCTSIHYIHSIYIYICVCVYM